MSKNVLLLGSGLVTDPLIQYLLKLDDVRLTIATLELDKALRMLDGHIRGRAIFLDAGEFEQLEKHIQAHDLTISLLPAPMHPAVARLCLKHRRNMLTASYVSPQMKALDDDVRQAGLLFLNELGLDPGIDHMSAMRIIHHIERYGGRITGFRSYCGGLPAPEANDNPLGYKFSWAPRGVFSAATNDARYLSNGTIISIPGKDLFKKYELLKIKDFEFEAYPNRDSMPYIELYGLQGVRTMFRGTLRYPGWCHIVKALVDAGYLDQTPQPVPGGTFSDLSLFLAGKSVGNPRMLIAEKTGLKPEDPALDAMEWIGLFSQDELDSSHIALLDHFAAKCLEKMQYAQGERDMVVLHHVFDAEIDGQSKQLTSSLVDFGIPDGHSAMARTVSLPAAIGARLMLEGKIDLTGVHIPVAPAIYEPILSELDTLNIRCVETGL